MTPDVEHLKQHSFDALRANMRGVAIAAWLPLDQLARLLGGDLTAANQLQEQARYDWQRLILAVQQKRPN